MSNFLERNKIFFAIIIAGLLISSAIRSLNRPAYVPSVQPDLSGGNEIKNSVVQSLVSDYNNREENNPAKSSGVQVKSSESQSDLYRVIKVIDGDTVSVDVSGKTETVRLIGINTPEIVDPRKPVECFGKEASNKAKEILTGKSVKLESDNTAGERDKYNRLLRYIFLDNGTNFNKMMIGEGFAYEYTYNLPYKYQTEFKQEEQEAKIARRGLWASGVCDSVQSSVQSLTPTIAPIIPSQKQGNHICSYNAYNCTDFSTHAEAQAVYEDCGGVNNDVHSLDRDKDGSACESLP